MRALSVANRPGPKCGGSEVFHPTIVTVQGDLLRLFNNEFFYPYPTPRPHCLSDPKSRESQVPRVPRRRGALRHVELHEPLHQRGALEEERVSCDHAEVWTHARGHGAVEQSRALGRPVPRQSLRTGTDGDGRGWGASTALRSARGP